MHDELLERIREFNSERDWGKYHSPKNLAMSVLIESAELAEIFQWCTEEESWNPSAGEIEHAGEEIADVLIYLLNLSDKLGIDPFKAAFRKMEINRLKYPADISRGSSLKYSELGRNEDDRD